jgi:hypothetical protein
MLIQIFVTFLVIIAFGNIFFRFYKAHLGRNEFLFWLVFWLVVLILVWNPQMTNHLASFLGVGRGADAVFYLSIVLLFYIVFRLYAKLENLESKLSELVKKIALKDLEKEDKQK